MTCVENEDILRDELRGDPESQVDCRPEGDDFLMLSDVFFHEVLLEHYFSDEKSFIRALFSFESVSELD